MTARRTLAAIAALASVALFPSPALAHGAPSTPVSRAYACGAGTPGQKASAACKAAVAAGLDTVGWDDIRVANVNGRDRDVIPDGKLCSAGLAAYRGLDLPRADWPATRLTPGATLTFQYAETIAHKGTFRLYLTKDGYTPTKALRWSDLEPAPFATATDPPLQNKAYTIKATLPKAKSGPHLIYTVWQNSNTPDTYYSCSDVLFPAAAPSSRPASAAPPAPTGDPSPATAGLAAHNAPAGPATSPGPPRLTAAARLTSAPVLAGLGGALVLALAGLPLLRRRRRRPTGS